jgi:regulator of sigma E protease
MLEASPGRSVLLRIERGGLPRSVEVTPRDDGGTGRIGVSFRTAGVIHRELGPREAAMEAVRINLELSKTLFLTLQKLVGGEISVRTFAGPMEIARASREAVKKLEWFLTFLAFISLQLGILNLLPIPVLDGGHILILAVESLMRRDLSDRVKERVMQAGLVFLLAFFGMVVYFDVIKAFFSS